MAPSTRLAIECSTVTAMAMASILRLAGVVDWPWLAIILPLWAPLGVFVLVFLCCLGCLFWEEYLGWIPPIPETVMDGWPELKLGVLCLLLAVVVVAQATASGTMSAALAGFVVSVGFMGAM